jgi:fibulin 1/2
VAPFWSDNDIRTYGSVCYEVFDQSSDSLIIEDVSEYISDQTGSDFEGTWMLLAEWNEVHPYPHGSSWDWWADDWENFTSKQNTYQAVLITNGFVSYSIFTYHCQNLQWSGYWRHATIGYNAGGEYYYNHPLTGLPQVNNIACLNQPADSYYNLLNKLSTSIANERREECNWFYQRDKANNDIKDINKIAETLTPCPCTIWQAWRDRRFAFEWTAWYEGYYCFQQRIASPTKASQLCCYEWRWGALDSSKHSGNWGTSMILYHSTSYPDDFRQYDYSFRSSCCSVGLCKFYYDRRPLNDCSSYVPPRTSWGWGDPHMTTLDGLKYTFNGLGEYKLLELDDGSFKFQGRTAKFNSSVNATKFSSLAFQYDEIDTIEIENNNGELIVYHNQTNITDLLSNVNDTFSSKLSIVSRLGQDSILVAFENGIFITVNVSTECMVHYVVGMPTKFEGQVIGMLGNFDGIGNNDLMDHFTGQIIDPTNEMEVFDFGETWKVKNESESLFMTPEPNPEPSFEPTFYKDILSNVDSDIVAACNNNPECMYDVIVTGSVGIGKSTLNIYQNNVADSALLSNFPPKINGDDTILVQPSVPVKYTFTVNDKDSDDMPVVKVVGSQPNGGYLLNIGQHWEYNFIWDVSQSVNISVTFVAYDEHNSTTIFTPQIVICGCINDGNCTYNVPNLLANPLILSCDCLENVWSGQFCQYDSNGCNSLQCSPGVDCIDNPAPDYGATCLNCPDGYYDDERKCIDINECYNSTSNDCDQICLNTEGSYECHCYSGYRLYNGTYCEDINECTETYNDCHQICVNVPGSYNCSCKEGLVLNDTSGLCEAEVPCIGYTPSSMLLGCANNSDVMEYYCVRFGYSLRVINERLHQYECLDINECNVSLQFSPCEHKCENTLGSFICTCNEGYEISTDGRHCIEVDKCLNNALTNGAAPLCSIDKLCINVPGSYNCQCPLGTIETNQHCIIESLYYISYNTTTNSTTTDSTTTGSNTTGSTPTGTIATVTPTVSTSDLPTADGTTEDPTIFSIPLIVGMSLGSFGVLCLVAFLIISFSILYCKDKRKKMKIHSSNNSESTLLKNETITWASSTL